MKNNKKNTNILKIFFIVLAMSVLTLSSVVLAQPKGPSGSGASGGPSGSGASDKIVKLDNPIKAYDVKTLLFNIVDIVIFLGVIAAVFMFFYAGFQLVMAQGSEDAIKDAKQMFINITIGTAILISSKVIVEVIKNTLINTGVVNEKVFTLPQ